MSACQPSLKSSRPGSCGNLPARSLLTNLTKVKRSTRRTMLIYRRMMSYLAAVPCSRAVHHPRMLRKPTREKGHLADPVGQSVSQGVGCGGNLAGTNDHQHQLTNMCLTRPGASPHQCHPCTHLTGPPPRRK